MAAKTGQEIVSDMMFLLQGTELADEISGGLYREGTRPRGSEKEDCVVIFTEANASQFQSGVVTLNIYVPDLQASGSTGVCLPDTARCEEIEGVAARSVRCIRNVGDYRITLRSAISTARDEDIHQSFVVVRLQVRHYNKWY